MNLINTVVKVYYTLNGSTPTTNSSYVDSSTSYKVLINSNVTLKAFANNGTVSSPMITASYIFQKIVMVRLPSELNAFKLPENISCYTFPDYFYGDEILYNIDKFDLNPNQTRMNKITFSLSGIVENPDTTHLIGYSIENQLFGLYFICK